MAGWTIATLVIFALGASAQTPPVYGVPPPVALPFVDPPVYAPSNATDCSFRFSQCGGMSWSGPTCCWGDNSCFQESQWYSQCLPTELPPGVVPEWGQCGGEGWTGSTTCEDLTTCQVLSAQTSKCISVIPQSPKPPSPPPSPPAPNGCAYRYDQCGGLLFGNKCCVPGNVCTVQNAWYSQCLPAPVAPGVKRQYEQCGSAGQPNSPCETGFTCKTVDQFYSVCA